ncbi:bypass of stop codon 6 [Fusarium beomiforme]|uniref:Bypass of stop codon 6 n=1 Tax=Fusarium beomiforme TaxID=44412 RepID=A0A9P5DYV3_9HYPO|nr:bypass of stop codon 6 [Fusarium beomiforme]
MGMNDASLGALLPYIETYYGINYTTVSTLFLVPVAGYVAAALTNNWIHYTLGQRGVAILGPVCRLVAYTPVALHPPFPVLPCVMLFTGFGNGIQDSGYNAWVGNMHRANELLGFLHGAYGLGGTIGPLIASAMVTEGNLNWYMFYYIMIGLSAVELVVGTAAFWNATGLVYRQRVRYDEAKDRATTQMALKEPITWIVAVFLLGYVATEVSLGGWIVTFMLRVRHAKPFLAGLTVTLLWLGLTLGRVVLGFATERTGEKTAIMAYLLLSIGLELLYWLVPNFIASVIFVMVLGFFLGPLFPAAMVAATKLLPADYHVSAIGFAAAVGGGGAAVGPFAVGAIAQKTGVQVLQPIIVGLLSAITLVWLLLPGGFRKGGLERAREQNLKPGGDVKEALLWVRSMVKTGGRT